MTNPYLAGTVPVRYSPSQYRSLELWYDYLDATYPLVREFEFTNIPADSDHFAVYVEYRTHPYMEYVLRNVMHFLGPQWGLQIFTWPRNRPFVEQIVADWSNVDVVELPETIPGEIPYDSTFRSLDFWSMVKGQYQLFFDLNSLLCHTGIEQFVGYDYVAPPWRPPFGVSPQCQFGTGGLSLRKRTTMIEICRTANSDAAQIPREDVFFSVHLRLDASGVHLPTLETATQFAVECVYHEQPLGLHMPWVCLPAEQIQSLLSTIKYE